MASVLSRVFTGQPQGPVYINWGHPLAQGLNGLWIFSDSPRLVSSQGRGSINLVNGWPSINAGTTDVRKAVNSHGGAIGFATTGDHLTLTKPNDENAQPLVPTSRVTMLLIRRKTDTTLRDAILGVGGVFGTNICKAWCPFNDGVIYFDFGGAGAGSTRINTGVLSWNTQVESFAFVAGGNGMAIYRNGVRLASHTTAASRDNTFAAGEGEVRLNATDVLFGGDLVQINYFAILNAEWTPTMVKQWHEAPYSIVRPMRSVADNLSTSLAIGWQRALERGTEFGKGTRVA